MTQAGWPKHFSTKSSKEAAADGTGTHGGLKGEEPLGEVRPVPQDNPVLDGTSGKRVPPPSEWTAGRHAREADSPPGLPPHLGAACSLGPRAADEEEAGGQGDRPRAGVNVFHPRSCSRTSSLQLSSAGQPPGGPRRRCVGAQAPSPHPRAKCSGTSRAPQGHAGYPRTPCQRQTGTQDQNSHQVTTGLARHIPKRAAPSSCS